MSNASFGVLLIGDQPECLRLLRQQQFEVVCADRLADGLAQFKAAHVGLVLVSLSLPDAQGTEAFVKVHEAAPHLPIIVLATPSGGKTGGQPDAAGVAGLFARAGVDRPDAGQGDP